jgi:hypothetical protein
VHLFGEREREREREKERGREGGREREREREMRKVTGTPYCHSAGKWRW